ncbi:hypothetical protein ACSNOI_40985 [Actinomadura kijaniata]|uniref:hypothetical protein n=1 Tax=Actinomadura kijaniata TaxID=46161 RepID=UPI003F1A98A2
MAAAADSQPQVSWGKVGRGRQLRWALTEMAFADLVEAGEPRDVAVTEDSDSEDSDSVAFAVPDRLVAALNELGENELAATAARWSQLRVAAGQGIDAVLAKEMLDSIAEWHAMVTRVASGCIAGGPDLHRICRVDSSQLGSQPGEADR